MYTAQIKKFTFWVIVVLYVGGTFWGVYTFFRPSEHKITCADFTTWTAAQKTYESNPTLYASLNKNSANNKIACENLYNKI